MGIDVFLLPLDEGKGGGDNFPGFQEGKVRGPGISLLYSAGTFRTNVPADACRGFFCGASGLVLSVTLECGDVSPLLNGRDTSRLPEYGPVISPRKSAARRTTLMGCKEWFWRVSLSCLRTYVSCPLLRLIRAVGVFEQEKKNLGER
jgi:hypothetical protein